MIHKTISNSIASDLSIQINHYLDAGWSLSGSMFVFEDYVYQCLVRETITISQEAHDSLISDQETLALIRKEGYSNQ